MVRHVFLCVFAACLTAALPSAAEQKQPAPASGNAVIWMDPGDIRSKDLFYGPGGKEELPQPPFKYEEEDKGGNSPKFEVTDGRDRKWKVKIGVEARPEVVSSRLLWAVGYFTNINYFFNDVRVDGMPKQLSRGVEFVDKAGEVFQARLQRKPAKDIKPWSWEKNPFVGTREFNGLRVMMALLRNWDLKDDNNGYYLDEKKGITVYYVTDVGSTFGARGKASSDEVAKNNVESYLHSKLISKVESDSVDFGFPTAPPFYQVFAVPVFVRQMQHRWVGRDVPRDHAKWIGSLLAQLTPEQINDAFRAGGYTPEQIQKFSAALRDRIAELTRL